MTAEKVTDRPTVDSIFSDASDGSFQDHAILVRSDLRIIRHSVTSGTLDRDGVTQFPTYQPRRNFSDAVTQHFKITPRAGAGDDVHTEKCVTCVTASPTPRRP